MRAVAELLGIGTTEMVRKWVRQAEIDDGSRPGVSTEESAELKRLKRESAKFKRANGIRKAVRLSCGRTVRHEAPGVSRGGERPYLLGSRRSALMKHKGNRSPRTTGIGGKRPQKASRVGDSCASEGQPAFAGTPATASHAAQLQPPVIAHPSGVM
jgi:hypothetical protein